ncbi:MAG: phospho-N-acetylmuramoyl-pentapeptide-transferase, partial [Streptosporangiaceae bacterium]
MRTIILSGAVALVTALLGTPLFIRLMRRLGYGQPIRVEGLKSHESKRGTPTMGGTVFVAASLIGYVAAHALTDTGVTASGVLVLMMMTGLGLVGFIDDFLKIFRQTSLGLRSRAKVAGQVIVAAVFGFEVLQRPDMFDLTPADARLSFVRDFGPVLATLPFVIWVVIMTVGASNAVNL